MLSIATMIMAAIFLMLPAVSIAVVAILVAGAGALAVVVPFEAMDPGARRRVLLASVAHLVAMIVAGGALLATEAGIRPVLVTAALAMAGAVLVGWAYATRNRRRRAGWNDYYD